MSQQIFQATSTDSLNSHTTSYVLTKTKTSCASWGRIAKPEYTVQDVQSLFVEILSIVARCPEYQNRIRTKIPLISLSIKMSKYEFPSGLTFNRLLALAS